MKFLKDVYCFTEYIYLKSQYPACPPSRFVITFRSRCGIEWDIKVMHVAWRAGFLPGLFQLSFQILHGFRSWVFIDDFIHYAPKILHRVNIWGIRGPACFLYKIWQVFFLHHAWVALAECAGAPSWTNVMHLAMGTEQFSLVCCFIHVFTVKDGLLICCWCSNRQSKSVLGVKIVSQWDRGLSFRPIWSILNFFKPDMLEEPCSPENPKQYQILDWAAETNIGDIRPKKENHPILPQWGFCTA